MIVIHEDVCKWVAEKTGGEYYAGSGQGIGWKRKGEIIAGVLFDNYNGNSVHVSLAGDGYGWLKRELLWFMSYYPFCQLKVKKVIALVDSTNKDAIRFNEHFGFIREATLEDAGKHGDLIIYTITKEQCRYLDREKLRNGKQI